MYKIGITGGIGSGKSEIIKYLQKRIDSAACLADTVANDLILPGHACYEPVIELLGKDIVGTDGLIDKSKMAEKIFHGSELRLKINAIIHPAVKKEIRSLMNLAAKKSKAFFFVEAALLIEDNYKEILDEVWYIHSDKEERKQRLIRSRSYSAAKIHEIMKSQLSDEDFFNAADFCVYNSGELEDVFAHIDERLNRL